VGYTLADASQQQRGASELKEAANKGKRRAAEMKAATNKGKEYLFS
jgi:hypothetical protein